MTAYVKFRIAKASDSAELAALHLKSGKHQVQGFMHRLGPLFLRRYYEILLAEPSSVVLLAEDSEGLLHGFVSGTVNAEEHLKTLKKNKYSLAAASLTAIVTDIAVLKELFRRKGFVEGRYEADEYAVTDGARLEYWIWRKSSSSNLSSILLRSWLEIMRSLGTEFVCGEVDSENTTSITTHMALGAKLERTVLLRDGRNRHFYKYNLQ